MGTIAALALIAASCAMPALAADDLAEGDILVADRQLRDPNFAKSVVYVITYDDQGAVGLVLNHQTEATVADILEGIKEAERRRDPAFLGGPIQTDNILALYRSHTNKAGTQHIAGEVYALLDETLLKKTLAAGAGPNVLRFYKGFAAWGPGQLENEIDAGAWHVVGGSADWVFDKDPASLWDRLIRRGEGTLATRTRARRSGQPGFSSRRVRLDTALFFSPGI